MIGTNRDVLINPNMPLRDDPFERGATSVWESDTNECGELVRLDRTPDGRYWVSITDMEDHEAAWLSSDLTPDELRELARAIALEVG